MQTRKIALHRNSLIAIVMTLLVLGSALAIAGNSIAITPQKGTVTYQASYLSVSNKHLPATGAEVTVSTLSGYQVATLSGALNQTSLPYGTYIFTMHPYETYGASYIVNGTSKIVNVTSSTPPIVELNATAYKTHDVAVTVNGAKQGAPATVTFSTMNGFVFETNTTTGTFNASLPTSGFYATVSFGGQINTTYESNVSSNLQLGVPGENILSGYVVNSNNQAISNFNVIAINPTSKAYSILPFTNGVFQIYDNASLNYVISAKGYNPIPITSKTTYTLNKANSTVLYNYTLGNNPANLYLNVTYTINNSTALSFLPNATVGSFYWQKVLDGAQNSAIENYLNGLAGNYTDYSILVNGYNYKLVSSTKASISSYTNTNLNATVKFRFQNSNVTLSNLANGFSVNLFAQGTQYNTGSLYYVYEFNYNVSGVSLSSPLSAAQTFKNPVILKPQSASGFLTLNFKSVSLPTLAASQIKLFWDNTSPTNYLVTSNSTSASFVAPVGKAISMNVSAGFYNPVTGTNDYQHALSWTWSAPSGVSVSGTYNATTTFTTAGNYSLTVTFESSSGATNHTTFNIYAFENTPTAALNVTSDGSTLFPTATVSSTVNVTVPQSKVVQFSGYGSYLNIPNTSYKAPLIYSWYFPGYTNSAMNVTQTFNTPFIANNQLIVGYLNVSSAVGKVISTKLLINVSDTTPPSAQLTVQNTNHTTIAQPIAGQTAIFTANGSTDKYYGTDIYYNWSIVYANGTNVAAGSSTYQFISNSTNQSYVMVKFYTLSSLIVSLKVTNLANVSSYSNFTTSMVVVSPRLIVQSVYFPTTPAQDSKTVVYLNISNNGTVDANSFYIIAIVNGKIVNNQSYSALPVGTTKQFEFNFTSPSQGNVQVQFEAINSTQPAFFASNGALTVTQKVSPPGYQTPLIVGGVILIIVVIGAVYYRLSSRSRAPKPKETKKQTPAKKTDEKKK